MNEAARTWGPVVVATALLPLAFVVLRACLPPIGGAPPPLEPNPPEVRGGEVRGGEVRGGEVRGSERCAGCHADAAAAWGRSTHARAERPLGPDDPSSAGALVASGPQGIERAFEPVRVIGADPLWQYLIPFDGGRLQVSQAAWDPAAGEWFDVFGDDRAAGEWGHWTGGAMTWNSQCASCHSTEVHKGYDADMDRYDTSVLEHRVGCTACHGAAPEHLRGGAAPILAPDRIDDVCASCHARRAELTGAFEPGERFLDHFAPSLVDRSDTFWPDGQVRAEDFEYTAFIGSKMHAAGVRCVDCHDPHTAALVRSGDALCLGCHQVLPGFAPHDPHPEGAQPGIGCVGCHMPITVYMQRDPRHDHGFVVPDPRPSTAGGPDVCTRCHTERDASWAEAEAEAWWGDLAGPRRARAERMLGALAGDEGVVAPLLQQLASDPIGAWRASAAAGLEAFLDRAPVRLALIEALQDPDPHVRFAVAGALGLAAADPRIADALHELLLDPVRAVRVAAARGVRSLHRPGDPAVADYQRYLERNADQPAALHELGSWHLEAGSPTEAVRVLRRAVRFDPGSAQLHDALAVALSVYGRPGDAAEQLRIAVELQRTDPELWYRLALAEAGVGDLQAATSALRRTLELDGSHARAWYNLGLIAGRQARPAEALEALRRAVEAAPRDPEIRYGLASTLWQQGEHRGAVDEARAVLRLDPDHQGAQAILAQ